MDFIVQTAGTSAEKTEPKIAIQKRGRPKKTFETKAKRSKKRSVKDLYDKFVKAEYAREEFTEAAIRFLYQKDGKGENSLARLLEYGYKHPERIDDMLNTSQSPKPQITPLAPLNALALLLDFSLTRTQYDGIRLRINSCGRKILPHYDLVLEEKTQCRPPKESLVVDDVSARVDLKSLLDHTISRIALVQKDAIVQSQINRGIGSEICTLIVPWGFDGSTGQANFKQTYTNDNHSPIDDSSLFATVINPQRLISFDGTILWQNLSPQSIRLCRPIHLQFAKETKEHVIAEQQAIELEIKNLHPFIVTLNNEHQIIVKYYLCLSMIDGKVLNMITNTRYSLACALCSSTSAEFNNLDYIGTEKFNPKQDRLVHGISPTHTWIRCLEFVFGLACKIPFKTWAVRKCNRDTFKETKATLQAQLWKKMGLRIAMPNSNGSGTSNDGNTARRAFCNYSQFSEILGIDKILIKGLRTILILLNCQQQPDILKYNEFCKQWLHRYITFYNWNFLTPTVHKILIHGGDIINASLIPVGMLGEEASEARNKVYKQDRIKHTRKMSRKTTMEDLFNRSMDATDPFISLMDESSSAKLRKKIPLPVEVSELLVNTTEVDIANETDSIEVLNYFQDAQSVELEEEVSVL